MKILLVNCYFYPESNAGAVVYCYELANALKQGNEVAIFSGTFEYGNEVAYVRDTVDQMEVCKVPLPRKNDAFYRYKAIYNKHAQRIFRQFLKEQKPNIIHFHSLQGLGASLVSEAKRLGIPAVVTLHDGWWVCPAQFFFRYDEGRPCQKAGYGECIDCRTHTEKMQPLFLSAIKNTAYVSWRQLYLKNALKKADAGIFPSSFLREAYRRGGVICPKAVISPNAIDISSCKDTCRGKSDFNPAQVRMAFLSGTSELKGYNLLMGALKNLNKDNFCLHIYGVTQENYPPVAEKNVVFHPPFERRDIHRVFCQTDILLFPSLVQENCPLSILESFAHKVPVIAAEAGGVAELVKDNVNGLLFRHNDVTSLTEKMQSVLDNPSIIQRFAGNISTVKDIREQAREIEGLYRSITKA